MKLRIRGNSLRLRLGQQEVAQFADTGQVTDRIRFGPAPDQHLTYGLRRTADITALAVSQTSDRIMVLVPTDAAHAWTTTDQVSLRGSVPVDAAQELSLLVEKDFACLVPRGEDDRDAFPHPRQGEQVC